MTQDELKNEVAKAALKYVTPGTIIGVGTGSTANFFIDQLATIKDSIQGAVASSIETANRLKRHGINVINLNKVEEISVYIDGADEINPQLQLIKGGGAALTREKIVAAVAREFVCIADQSKWVEHLGAFPLPVEVIPMARSYVARELLKLGGDPVWRDGVVTDNGNVIIDVHGLLPIAADGSLERAINQITGVVTNGLFAIKPASLVLLGTDSGIQTHRC